MLNHKAQSLNFKYMDTTLYKIDGRNYKMFTLNIFGKPMNVASYALNRKIEKMIGQGRYHEVIDIDEQYGYYLPKEVDETDEREMIESIEDVVEEDVVEEDEV